MARRSPRTVGKAGWIGQVSPASSYLSSSDARVHFGLGAFSQLDRVEIRWPNGEKQTLTAVPADRILTVTQGQPLFAPQGAASVRPAGAASVRPAGAASNGSPGHRPGAPAIVHLSPEGAIQTHATVPRLPQYTPYLQHQTPRLRAHRRRAPFPSRLHGDRYYNFGCHALLLNSVEDHIHLLFALGRTVAMSKAVEEIRPPHPNGSRRRLLRSRVSPGRPDTPRSRWI